MRSTSSFSVGRLVFGAQIRGELLEIFFAFPRENHENAGEAVTAAVLGDRGFPFGAFGTTG